MWKWILSGSLPLPLTSYNSHCDLSPPILINQPYKNNLPSVSIPSFFRQEFVLNLKNSITQLHHTPHNPLPPPEYPCSKISLRSTWSGKHHLQAECNSWWTRWTRWPYRWTRSWSACAAGVMYKTETSYGELVCGSWWTSWESLRLWRWIRWPYWWTRSWSACAAGVDRYEEDNNVFCRTPPAEYKMLSVWNLEASFWRWYSVEALRPPFGDDTRPYLPENTRPPMTHIIHDQKSIKMRGNSAIFFFNEKEYPRTQLSSIFNHRIDNQEYKLIKLFPSPKQPSSFVYHHITEL